jgi:hypothetical protein
MKMSLIRTLPVALLLGFCTAVRGQADQKQVLHLRVRSVVDRLEPISVLADSTRLNLVLVLPLRNQSDLDHLLQDIYNPASPGYRQYLRPAEFAAKFGPTLRDYEKLKAFARANHFDVRRTHSNRTLLDVSGTVADIHKAFGVNLKVYPHPSEQRTFYAPDRDPIIDAGVPVLAIKGLDNFILPHPSGHVKPLGGSGSNGSYQGTDFRSAYAPGVTLTGNGQQVALVEFDGYYASDITKYQSITGLPSITLTNVLVDGYSGLPDALPASVGEVSMDIELVNAMAPGISLLLVYEAPIPSPADDLLNQIATDDLASQISSSWLYDIDTVSDQIFQQYAAQGQSFITASGDRGAYAPGQVAQPMDSPYITAAGGTELTTSTNPIAWESETVWNGIISGVKSSSGGGYTTNYPIPTWQIGAINDFNNGSPTFRNIPDVACVADDILVTYDNGRTAEFEGTSSAAPLWAGFIALVNEQAASYGNGPIGFLNPALYEIGNSAGYPTNFNDITTGSNTNADSPDDYFAVAGYDLCTGWGTPNGSNLINSLAPPDSLVMLPLPGFASSGPEGGPFNVTTESFLLTNEGTAPLTWSLQCDSSWLSGSPTNGSLGPGETTNVIMSLTDDASNLFTGYYTSHLTLTNLSNGLLHHRSFSLQISDALSLSPAAGLEFGGPPSGPFNAATQICVLTNASADPMIWSVANNPSWLNISPSNGVLDPFGVVLVSCSLDADATNLSVGAYSDNLVITNSTFAAEESVPVLFLVGQLVQNGGFETGTFSGWTFSGNTNLSMVVSGNTNYVHSGNYGAELGEAGDVAYLLQSIPTVPGASYSLSLWLDSPDGLTPLEFSVSWGGDTLFDSTNLAAIGWTNMQFDVIATNTSTVLSIGSRDDQSFLGLDDVSVVEAPPTLSIITPSNGPVMGGTTVTIIGSGFQSHATVAFGSLPAASVTFNGATNLTVVTPSSLLAGPVDLFITNADGQTAVFSNAFAFVGPPIITWTNPPALTYGTALGAAQLNASADVAGAFSYVPPAGTVLDAGTNMLSAVFTPTNLVDYFTVTDYVGLVVSPAQLSVTASNATRPYGVDNPAFTGLIVGLQNGDNITANYGCSATPASPAGAYQIVPGLVDPAGRLPNYQVSSVDGTLTVLPPVLPEFQVVALSGNALSFNWSATAGVAYQVQYSSDLTTTNWIDLGDLIIATNTSATTIDTITNSQLFYRVLLVPQ